MSKLVTYNLFDEEVDGILHEAVDDSNEDGELGAPGEEEKVYKLPLTEEQRNEALQSLINMSESVINVCYTVGKIVQLKNLLKGVTGTKFPDIAKVVVYAGDGEGDVEYIAEERDD